MDVSSHHERIKNDLLAAAMRGANMSAALDVLSKIEGLPAEARISPYDVRVYRHGEMMVDVTITYSSVEHGDADTLAWPDRVRPIGQVFRAFGARPHKAYDYVADNDGTNNYYGTYTSARHVDEHGQVTYSARATLDGWTVTLEIKVPEGGISPTCTIETYTETVTETVTQEVTRTRVTCPDKTPDPLAQIASSARSN